MGQLTPGPASLGLRQAGHSWVGQLIALGFILIGSGILIEGVGPGPKAPTMPPFSLPGREILPVWEIE